MKASTKAKLKKKAVKANGKIVSLKDLNFEVNSAFASEQIMMHVYEDMILSEPDNPAEIMAKMNISAPNFYLLGSAKVEMENEMIRLENLKDDWMSAKKSRLHGDKSFKSEKAKEDHVKTKYKKKYADITKKIRMAKYKFEKLEIALKSFDKYIGLLQSMGAMVRQEIENIGADGYTIGKRTKKRK